MLVLVNLSSCMLVEVSRGQMSLSPENGDTVMVFFSSYWGRLSEIPPSTYRWMIKEKYWEPTEIYRALRWKRKKYSGRYCNSLNLIPTKIASCDFDLRNTLREEIFTIFHLFQKDHFSKSWLLLLLILIKRLQSTTTPSSSKEFKNNSILQPWAATLKQNVPVFRENKWITACLYQSLWTFKLLCGRLALPLRYVCPDLKTCHKGFRGRVRAAVAQWYCSENLCPKDMSGKKRKILHSPIPRGIV